MQTALKHRAVGTGIRLDVPSKTFSEKSKAHKLSQSSRKTRTGGIHNLSEPRRFSGVNRPIPSRCARHRRDNGQQKLAAGPASAILAARRDRDETRLDHTGALAQPIIHRPEK